MKNLRARVVLEFNDPVKKPQLREINDLTKGLTTDRASIEITLAMENVVEVVFIREPGRQIDVVEPIFKTYRTFMQTHAEISVYFETPKKRF